MDDRRAHSYRRFYIRRIAGYLPGKIQDGQSQRLMPWGERIYRFRLPLFYACGAAALLLLIAGFLLDTAYAGLLAFGIVGVLIALFDFRILFYLLLLVLPLSNEIEVANGLSIYIPTEPLTIILLVIGVVYCLLHPQTLSGTFWKHPLTIIVIAHIGWVAISTVSSTHPLVSAKYFLAKLWFVSTYYFMAAYIIRTYRTFRRVFWLLFITTLAGMVYIMIRHASSGFLFDVVSSVVRPFYRNHVNYGVWITAIFPLILLARTWYKKDTLMRLFLNGSLVLNLAAIYFSYTRGAWVALICMPVFYLIVKWRAVKPALIASTAGILVFLGMIFNDNLYLQYAPDYNKTIYHEDFSDHMAATFQMQDMSTVERFYRWIAAFKMFRERPVSGFGPGNFVNNYKTYTVSAYETYISDNEEGSSVHNYFLTMLTEQGIPGLLIFVTLIVAVLLYFEAAYHRQDSMKGKNLVMALACCFLALLINNMFSDLLEADKLGPLFFLCMALVVNIDRQALDMEEQRLTIDN
jgi:O-antigen ligase